MASKSLNLDEIPAVLSVTIFLSVLYFIGKNDSADLQTNKQTKSYFNVFLYILTAGAWTSGIYGNMVINSLL